jgi:response regulator of citrate/malate metabolism
MTYKLTQQQVDEVVVLLETTLLSLENVGKQVGVSEVSVRRIMHGRHKLHTKPCLDRISRSSVRRPLKSWHRDWIRQLSKEGCGATEIARRTKSSRSTVWRVLNA